MSIKYTKEDKYAELKKRLNDTIDSEKEQRQKIKDLEIKNGELSKKNFEFQSHLQNLIIKMNLISQENSTLKLEIKKLQLSVNSPGKVVASLGTTNKSDLSTDNLLKEKSELKEENEKLLLMLSDKESILSKQKIEYENEINDLNKIITEQTGKINDITNDMTDLQQQLNIKIKEIKKLKEDNEQKFGIKEQKEFKKIKIDYDLLLPKYEEIKNLKENLQEKCNILESENKSLNTRVIKIEQSFNNLVNTNNPKIKDVKDLDIYNNISNNLRTQITEIQDDKEKMEKLYNNTNAKFKEDYKTLENKYININKENEELQKQIEEIQNNFITDTMKLNNEISNLNKQINNIQKENNEYKNKYQNLLKDLETNKNNFDNLQKIMTKLREKDDIDITLIEERYIVLENVLEQEKNELVNTNKELLNKIKYLNQKNGISGNGAPGLESSFDKNSSEIDLEIKNLKEENKLLQKKIKEQEKRFFELQKKTDILNILKEENQLLKKNIKENEVNLRKVIKELTNKANQLNEELLQSRKRTSLLRSKPSVENINMINEIEKYKKDIEKLKQENEKQKQKDKEEIESLETQLSTLKGKIAEEAFNKDNEIMKYKNLCKKYKDMLETNGIIKKK
jgi:exonuclease SbcC